MQDVVIAACRWLENTWWAAAIRESSIAYPLLQWIHFAGLSLWLGACLIVDLRLIGVGPRRQTAGELSNCARTAKWIGFAVAFAGGLLVFAAYATMYVSNAWFVLKVALLTPLAVTWHLVVQNRAAAWSQAGHTSAIGKWAAGSEFAFWILVVTAAVGFLLTNVS